MTSQKRMDHDTAAYWAGLSERQLRLCRCGDCNTWIHPPRGCCPVCWSDSIVHASPSGEARLYTYLVQPVAPGRPPEVIGWAELVEQKDLFVVASIEGMPLDAVEVGAKLTLGFREDGDTFLPCFSVGDDN